MATRPDRSVAVRPVEFSIQQAHHRPQQQPDARPWPNLQAVPGIPSLVRNPGSNNTRPGTPARMPSHGAIVNNHQLLQADSSSSEEEIQPRSRTASLHYPPRHNRSMSHPFPSLFSSTRKKKPPQSDLSDSESAGDAGQMLKPKKQVQQQARGHRNGSSSTSKDFATGNCMTCGSLVRWPKELHVFKCTICLTINDLEPLGPDNGRDSASKRGQHLGEDRLVQNAPISLEHTKSLANECLRSFLRTALARKVEPESLGQAVSSRNAQSQLGDATIGRGVTVPNMVYTAGPKPPSVYTSNPFEGLEEPTLRPNGHRPTPRSYSSTFPDGRPAMYTAPATGIALYEPSRATASEPEGKRIFKPLEDYIVNCVTSFQCLNESFATPRSVISPTTGSDTVRRRPPSRKEAIDDGYPIIDLDPKLLLLGDFAENGSWWTGRQGEKHAVRTVSHKGEDGSSTVNMRSPCVNWADLDEWYHIVIESARSWSSIYNELVDQDVSLAMADTELQDMEAQILIGQDHAQRTLLKATETILKRPGRIITETYELRFLLMLVANPLLYAPYKPFTGGFEHIDSALSVGDGGTQRGSGPASGRHSGIIKRILGLMSNAPPDCHSHFISWFAKLSEVRFVQLKDLVHGFLAYRLIRQNDKRQEVKFDVTDGLIPSMAVGRSHASLHAALGQQRRSASTKKLKEKPKNMVYQDDWQIKAAAQVLAFLFAANKSGSSRRSVSSGLGRPQEANPSTRDRIQARGQMLATSDFYITLLDDSDLVADFESWERKRAKFSFCQYPFLLSIGAKIQILEYDARRQMQTKARDAFFDSIMTHRTVEQFLTLSIRRECLVEDSLRAVSGVIGAGGEDIKKGLKITFTGEEGVDAGGLRKEWFLLLVREVFNPDHGMFTYDEDSQYCYFNPHSLEPSEQFFLVGIVFGLAIYNSTILGVALPPFAFRKLLMAAPPPIVNGSSSTAAVASHPRPVMTYTLEDLAEYRPRLASGLRQLLEFDGDVETTFCLDFAIDVDKYGAVEQVPLCLGGERRAVTNANRREYVDLYVRHLLDSAVARQFEPFKRGFFTVCGGNALSLFRPEEIELLVRGSDESLDIAALRAMAHYDGWNKKGIKAVEEADDEEDYGDGLEPTLRWFWASFEAASPRDQRRLLAFITGSDRIPAMGAASLSIRITCLGDDEGRFPTARTCFNMLSLYRVKSRARLDNMLWRAVNESEGFGLK